MRSLEQHAAHERVGEVARDVQSLHGWRPLVIDAKPAARGVIALPLSQRHAFTQYWIRRAASSHSPLIFVAASPRSVPGPDRARTARREVGLAGSRAGRVVRGQAELKGPRGLVVDSIRVVEGTLPAGWAARINGEPRQARQRHATGEPRLLARKRLDREARVRSVEFDRRRDKVSPVAQAAQATVAKSTCPRAPKRLPRLEVRRHSHEGTVWARTPGGGEATDDGLEGRRLSPRVVVVTIGVIDLQAEWQLRKVWSRVPTTGQV